VDVNLVNAKILTKDGFFKAGISIDGDRVVSIAKPPNLPKASKTINVKGNIALPGLIDAHVHLRDLDLSYKEDFLTGTCAAAAGGFTTVLDMPNTRPPTNTPSNLKEKMRKAKNRVVVNVGFYAAFPKKFKQIIEMAKNGAIAFKAFLHHPVTELDVNLDAVLLKAFSQAKKLNLPVAVHAEEGEVIKRVEDEFRKSGRNSLTHYLKAHSIERELNAVKRVLNLAERSGLHVHICHISASKSLKILNKFKSRVTCEVTPHHLMLTKTKLHSLGGIALVNPPFRSSNDTSALLRAVNEGVIDIIVSDHAPHTLEEKEKRNIWEVSPGIPGLETTLPLMLTQVNRGQTSLNQLIRMLATRPAEIFHIPRGSIQKGGFADIVIVDINQEYKIDSANFHSKAKYSPFDGLKVKGKPIKTFVNGQLVYDSGEIVAKPGFGEILRT
jgi:dihydroorotase